MNLPTADAPSEAQIEQLRSAIVRLCIEEGEAEVCRLNRIPLSSLREMQQEPWWKIATQQYYLTQAAKLDKGMTEVIDEAIKVAAERLRSGDAHFDRYEGIVYLPMKGKDAAAIAASLVEKRQVLRGQPGSIVKAEINLTAVAEKLRSIVPERPPGTTIVSPTSSTAVPQGHRPSLEGAKRAA